MPLIGWYREQREKNEKKVVDTCAVCSPEKGANRMRESDVTGWENDAGKRNVSMYIDWDVAVIIHIYLDIR